jgi:putative peptidoglycan lipid II flippase
MEKDLYNETGAGHEAAAAMPDDPAENGLQTKVAKTAGLLVVLIGISRVLGWVREFAINHTFGLSDATDAYKTAFLIPDTLFNILVAGALSTAFIPVFSSYIAKKQEKDGWEVASIFTSWIILLLGVGLIICYAFTPQMLHILAPKFDAAKISLTVPLTRIMLIQVIFMAGSGIAMGILHSYQRFIPSALGAMFYNVGIIAGGFLLAAPIEARWPGFGIAGFAVGVTVGAIINFIVQIPALRKINIKFKFNLNYHHPGVKRLVILTLPVLISLSVAQINLIITKALASGDTGMIAGLDTAQRLMQLPIGVFAIAIAMVVFPSLTRQRTLNKTNEFKKTMSLGIRTVAFITLPCAVGMAVLREPIIRLLFEFQSGEFTAAMTTFAGDALLYYCLGLVAYGLINVLNRAFYACQDTITPVIIGVVSIAVNIAFSFLLLGPMAQKGLALAYSIAGIMQAGLLLVLLRRKLGQIDFRHMGNSFIKTCGACVVMGLATFGTVILTSRIVDISTKMGQIIQLGASMGIAVLIFFGITYALKMEEAKMVIDMMLKKVRRPKVVGSGQ